MAPRLDTPLARALLDGAHVEPAALENAIEQQVLHGGTLDTLLLELGLVDEPMLSRLLAQAWGTAPVDTHAIEHPSSEAMRALPERMAVAMRVCPFLIDDAGLHVVVAAPLDRALIAEVARMLARPLVAHVVPEVRVWQALARGYSAAPEQRFVSLLASVTGGSRKVTPRVAVDPEGGAAADAVGDAELEPAAWDLFEALAHLAAQDTRDGVLRVALRFARRSLPFAALVGVRAPRAGALAEAQCHGWLRSGPAEGVAFSNTPLALPKDSALYACLIGPAPFVGRPEATEGNAALFGWLGRRRPRTFVAAPIVVGGRSVGALVGDGGVRAREVQSLAELVSFSARLGPAFEALLARRHHQHPSLFPIDAARVERDVVLLDASASAPAPGEPPSIAHNDVPAPPPPPPRPAPRPITITMPAVDAAPPPHGVRAPRDGTSPFARAYAAPAKSALTEPLSPQTLTAPKPSGFAATGSSLRDVLPRVVDAPAVLVDRIQAPAALQSFAHLDDGSAPAAWRGALRTTVERGHQGGSVAAEQRPKIFLDDGDWDDVVLDAASAADLAGPRHAAVIALPSLVEQISEAAPSTKPAPAEGAVRIQIAPPDANEPAPRSIEDLVDALGALDDDTVRVAQRELVAREREGVAALGQRFPGRLLRDPFDPSAIVPGPAQMGPLIALLAELGAAGLDAAIPHLDSRFPAHRFCAVLLFAHTPDARAIDLVRARLHDQEPRIQKLAADALAPFIAHPQFSGVLTHLRERLQAPLVDARRRAAQLLGAFRDVGAVSMLMALLDKPDLQDAARQALRLITLQDHGARSRAWERWWLKAKKSTRVDWLLEGLLSDDRELRSVAALELSALAGDDFGFHPDGDRAARKLAAESFTKWWSAARPKRTA